MAEFCEHCNEPSDSVKVVLWTSRVAVDLFAPGNWLLTEDNYSELEREHELYYLIDSHGRMLATLIEIQHCSFLTSCLTIPSRQTFRGKI
jgi:hypothetical protein